MGGSDPQALSDHVSIQMNGPIRPAGMRYVSLSAPQRRSARHQSPGTAL